MLLMGQGSSQMARPLSIAQIDASGVVWFIITSMDQAASHALEVEPKVALVCESKTVFLSVVGSARVIREAQKLEELWKVHNPTSPLASRANIDLTLIAVTPATGEFRDHSRGERRLYQFDSAASA